MTAVTFIQYHCIGTGEIDAIEARRAITDAYRPRIEALEHTIHTKVPELETALELLVLQRDLIAAYRRYREAVRNDDRAAIAETIAIIDALETE